jgi:hypothetical protein
MLLTKVKTLSAFICVALSLLVLPNNAVLADDGKLTNEKARQLISQLFNKQPDKLEVIGVMEPSQNVAQADIVITNLLVARPKNDAVTAYAFGPGGGSYLWSGRGKGNFVHYNDGRWVLTSLDTEVGSFTPKLSTGSAQTAPVVGQGDCEVILGYSGQSIASPYKGGCKDGLADGRGTYTYSYKLAPEMHTSVSGEFRKGKLNGHATFNQSGLVSEVEEQDNRIVNGIYRAVDPKGNRTAVEYRNGVLIARCSADGQREQNCNDRDRLLATH